MLRTFFVLAILVPGFIAALGNRFSALLLYLWFAMFRPQEFIWFDITSLRLSLVLSLVLVVPSILMGILPNISHPLSRGTLLFLLAAGLAQIDAVYRDNSWPWFDQLSRLVLVTLLSITLTNTARRFLLVVAVIGCSLGFFTSKAGIVSVLSGGARFFDGLGGAFSDNNGYALAATMILPLLFATAQNVTLLAGDRMPKAAVRWLRWGLMASVPATAFTVISTFSRGGFLALAATVLALVLLQRRRQAALIVLGLVAMLGLAFVPIPEGYVDRLETIRTYEERQEESALSRLHFWRVAIDMVVDRPLGVGLFNYQLEFNKYDSTAGAFGAGRSVHSSHFQVLAETGILGILSFAGLFIGSFRILFRLRSRSNDRRLDPEMQRLVFTASNALLASMIAFLVGGSFLAAALNDVTWLTFGLIASLDRIAGRKAGPGGAPASDDESIARMEAAGARDALLQVR